MLIVVGGMGGLSVVVGLVVLSAWDLRKRWNRSQASGSWRSPLTGSHTQEGSIAQEIEVGTPLHLSLR